MDKETFVNTIISPLLKALTCPFYGAEYRKEATGYEAMDLVDKDGDIVNSLNITEDNNNGILWDLMDVL